MMITVKYDSQKNQLSKYKSMSWRFPYKLSTIILAILVMAGAYFISPVSIAYAELNDLPSAIQFALNHVIDHSGISASDLEDFFFEAEKSVYSGAAKEDDRWVNEEAFDVKMYYEKTLSCIQYNIWVSHSGELLYCDCEQFLNPDLEADRQQWDLISDIKSLRKEWEMKYGPCELWNVQQNADFFSLTGCSPYLKTTGKGIPAVAPRYLPSDDQLSPDEAYRLLYSDLVEHLNPPKSKEKINSGLEDVLMNITVNEYVDQLKYGVYFSGEHWYFFEFYALMHNYNLYSEGEALVDANTGEVIVHWKNYDFVYSVTN